MNMFALTILCAMSIVLNILLGSFLGRVLHWANYWKREYYHAIKPISPVAMDLDEQQGVEIKEWWEEEEMD